VLINEVQKAGYPRQGGGDKPFFKSTVDASGIAGHQETNQGKLKIKMMSETNSPQNAQMGNFAKGPVSLQKKQNSHQNSGVYQKIIKNNG